MEQVCGIYKITNLANNKCYIGQSINISSRWKQHTQSLEKVKDPDGENPLRRAFLKYGLLQQVSQPGIYGNFKFEVLMESSRDELTKNEYAKIDELQPEYNRMMCPPSADRIWPRKENLEKCCYVQYHNYDAMGYLPYEGLYFRDLIEDSSYVSSKKRECLKLKGENVYLIVGIKQKGHKTKDFYLWDYTQIEEIEIKDYGDEKEYGVSGSHFLCKKPLRLNDISGFDHFAKHTMGSFAYGFQNAINDPFSKFLMDESHYTALKDMKKTTLEWLADFEDDIEDSDLWLTQKDENGKASWRFFCPMGDGSSALRFGRAGGAQECEPEFFADEFRKFLKAFPNVKTYYSLVSPYSHEFADAFPNMEHRLICGDCKVSKNEFLVKLSKKKNVVLMKNMDEPLKV